MQVNKQLPVTWDLRTQSLLSCGSVALQYTLVCSANRHQREEGERRNLLTS